MSNQGNRPETSEGLLPVLSIKDQSIVLHTLKGEKVSQKTNKLWCRGIVYHLITALAILFSAASHFTSVSAAQSGVREQIESMQDAGMLAVYDAGLVQEPGLTAILEPLQAGETVPDLSMTIDWLYIDRMRMAFGFHLSGMPYAEEACKLVGDIQVKDRHGNQPFSGHSAPSLTWDSDSGDIYGYQMLSAESETIPADETFEINAFLGETAESIYNVYGYFYFSNAHCFSTGKNETDPLEKTQQFSTGKFHFEIGGLSADQVLWDKRQEVQTVNEVQIRKLWAEITPSTTQVIVALRKPTAEHWNPYSFVSGNPVLSVSGSQITGYTGAILFDADLTDNESLGSEDKRRAEMLPDHNPGERYMKIIFDRGTTDPAQMMTMTIPSVEPFDANKMPLEWAARKIVGPWTFEIIPDSIGSAEQEPSNE